ncbi:MAG: integrin alpha [Deltaproteobacteria bacterium]|nr:integrin alpha [Deltaproteobacteria bacterium]
MELRPFPRRHFLRVVRGGRRRRQRRRLRRRDRGRPFYDNGQNNEGAFFVFHGSAAGVSSSPDTAWEPDLANAQIGRVAGAVDVNADGYDDVIVGAPNYGNGQNQEGAAYLFYGSGDGVESSPAWMMESDTATSWFGYAVAGAGDVNNDGYDDILVSQYKYGNGQSEEGRALLFLGSADGPVEPADWAAEGDQANAHYGSDVAGAGDVNGDGYDDVIVGAWEYDNGQNDEGRAYIYHGQVTTTTTTTSTTSTTTTSSSTTTTEPTTTTSTTSSSTTTSTEASTSTTTTEAPTTSSTTTTTAPDDDTDDDTGDDDDDSECWACTSSTECQLAFGNGWGCLDNCCAEAGPDDDDDDTGDDDLEGRGGDDDDDGGGCGCGC